MKSVCDAFDLFVRDYYTFAMSQLPEIRCDPPLTKVFVIRGKEDWEQTLRFVEKLSGMSKHWAKHAKAVWWTMPETREDRLKMGSEVMSDAYVDYDAYIAIHETKFTGRNMLDADEF